PTQIIKRQAQSRYHACNRLPMLIHPNVADTDTRVGLLAITCSFKVSCFDGPWEIRLALPNNLTVVVIVVSLNLATNFSAVDLVQGDQIARHQLLNILKNHGANLCSNVAVSV